MHRIRKWPLGMMLMHSSHSVTPFVPFRLCDASVIVYMLSVHPTGLMSHHVIIQLDSILIFSLNIREYNSPNDQHYPVFIICQNNYSNELLLYSLFISGVSLVIINIILPHQSSIRPKSIAIYTTLGIYLEESQKAIFCLSFLHKHKKRKRLHYAGFQKKPSNICISFAEVSKALKAWY